MYRPDDKDIDNLSREAAEHYQAPGTPAWDALHKTLEKELPQEKKRKRRGFLFFFLLLAGLSLAGSTIWYGFHTSRPVVQANQAPGIKDEPVANKEGVENSNADKIPATGRPNNKAAGKGSLPTNAGTSNKNAKDSNAGGATIIAVNKTATTASPRILKSRTTGGTRKSDGSGSVNNDSDNKNPTVYKQTKTTGIVLPAAKQSFSAKAIAANQRRKNLQDGHSPKNRKQSVAAAESAVTETQNDIAKTKSGDSVTNTDAITIPDSQASTEKNSNSLKDSAAATIPVVTTKNADSSKTPAANKPKSKSKNNKAILFGLTGGFDFSTVKFTHGSNAGYNIGLVGGYQFSKHLAALTGIIYTKKNYKLDGKDYNPPKHDWTYYVNLQTVDGFCRMWEIPVELRYTFNPGQKNIFFASAGLSSYFMKKQQYDYYYKNNAGMSMVAPWHNDSTFKHIFSILDLSAGVQKPVGKHLDLLIEPYAKIPLGGVGFGNIRLSSFGVNLTVQYKKQLKR